MKAITVTHVGMDVHARQIHYAVKLPGAAEVLTFQSEHSDASVRRVLGRLRREANGPIRAYYEAGPTGFGLQRLLAGEGIDCVVAAPSLIPHRPGDRCKTDAKDARKLRELGEVGLLKAVHVPTRAEEAARALTRNLEKSRHGVTRVKLQLSSMMLRLSITKPPGDTWTKAHRRWLAGLKLEQPSDRLVLEDLLLELAHCEQRQARLETKVEELAATEPFAAKVAALRCFKGIETATAMGLATELISPERFPDAKKVMGYAGLGISEDSSGETTRRGGITKTGNPHLRRLLVRVVQHARKPVTTESRLLGLRRKEAPAWAMEHGRRAERRLHDKYWRLLQTGKKEPVVMAAVARELAGWVWACLVHDVVAGVAAPVEVDADGVLVP